MRAATRRHEAYAKRPGCLEERLHVWVSVIHANGRCRVLMHHDSGELRVLPAAHSTNRTNPSAKLPQRARHIDPGRTWRVARPPTLSPRSPKR